MSKISNIIRLDSLLSHSCGYTLNELISMFDDNITTRTLLNYIASIQRPPYNAVLVQNLYRGRERVFRYKDTSFSISLADKANDLDKKVRDAIDALEVFKGDPISDWFRIQLITLQKGNLSDGRVAVFSNNPFLLGIEFFEPIAQAIINQYPLQLSYKPYHDKDICVVVHPYQLKQYNDRWFMIASPDDNDVIYNYALDRVVGVKHVSKPYKKPTIDIEDYFYDVVGVTLCDVPVENVKIKVCNQAYPYIATKPLHPSQKIVHDECTDEWKVVSIDVKPNYELMALLLSYGSQIEVLSPETIRQVMKSKIELMHTLYK